MITLFNTSPLNKLDDAPVMPRHDVTCIRSTNKITEGESLICFIAKMSCGRFAVMAANFTNKITYYEVFSEADLHLTFKDTIDV